MNSTSASHYVPDGNYDLAQMLADFSIDRVMAIDCDWKIIAWNGISERVTGLASTATLGFPLLDVFPAIADDPEMLLAFKNGFKGYQSFLPSIAGKFNRHYIENHYIPLKLASGEIIGVMNIMHDVAHRVKAEQKLAELNQELERKYHQLHDANQALSTFTHIAGFQIKEPLRNIYTSLELMAQKEGESLSTWSRGNLRRIQGSLNRINLLLSDLLTISELNQSDERTENLDLNEILSEELQRLDKKIKEKNVEIHVDTLPFVSGYRQMLKYLFRHLIENSIKFHRDDQTPRIKVTAQHLSKERGTFHQINFIDNGIGFPPEDKERIFEMFVRLEPNNFRGSGIGLSLCRKIIEMHGGTICAEGAPGKGAVFSCLLPATDSLPGYFSV